MRGVDWNGVSEAAVGAACAETSRADNRRMMVQSDTFAMRFKFSITHDSDTGIAIEKRPPMNGGPCR